jgi:NitT/TauT family transport system substrate-binding protein
MTSQKLVTEKPDVVQRFVDASIKGWYGYLRSERAKADALIIADNPDYSVAKADEAVAAMNQYELATSGDAATFGLGAMTEKRWQDFFDTMVEAGIYPADLEWKKAFTLQFVNKKVGLD